MEVRGGADTFILGAGFSRWISNEMPLMKDLLHAIRTDENLIEELHANRLSGLLALNSGFEALISHLYNQYPWKSEIEALYEKALYKKCVKVALEVLESSQANVDPSDSSEDANRLFRYWDKHKSTIVTFNYDTMVELGLMNQRQQKMYSLWKLPIVNINQRGETLDGAILDGGEYDDSVMNPDEYPTVLKLHGSHNWLHSGNFNNTSEQVYYYHPNDSGAQKTINSRGLSALIVPPSIDKSQFYGQSIIGLCWEATRKSLELSKRVFIIGYSIPVSDTYVELLFAKSFQIQPTVYVVNTDSSESFRKRVTEYFSDKDVNLDLDFIGEKAIEKMIEAL